MKHRPEMLIVAGAGRNVGKSTLMCQLIEKFSGLHPVAIKISPHFHQQTSVKQKYILQQESDLNTHKDSSRFLRAGAHKVYYLQSKDDHLQEAFWALSDILPPGVPLMVESGGLAKFVKPGLLIFVEGSNKKNEDVRQKSGLLLRMEQGGFDLSGIEFENGRWKHK